MHVSVLLALAADRGDHMTLYPELGLHSFLPEPARVEATQFHTVHVSVLLALAADCGDHVLHVQPAVLELGDDGLDAGEVVVLAHLVAGLPRVLPHDSLGQTHALPVVVIPVGVLSFVILVGAVVIERLGTPDQYRLAHDHQDD